MSIDSTDIVVGIPSYNEADNIAFVAHQASEGLRRYFSDYSSLIINVDNASEDGTREAFLKADTGTISKKYLSTKSGVKGKGNNFKNLFDEVKHLRPKVIVVVDADLRSINPEWIQTLVAPILHGYDYVTPIYSRNKYDGTITNHICYPLLFGLFNTDIRQPIAGDFSFSSELVDMWLGLKWETNVREYGIDIFMTTSALLNGFKRCQVSLGSKIHKPSAPKLGPMFTQVVTTLFDSICEFKESWMTLDEMKDSPLLGNYFCQRPQPLSVDYEKLMSDSLEGFWEHKEILKLILPPSVYDELNDMYDAKKWDITPEMWARILYDFIHSYDLSKDKSSIVEALKPLYFARVASFYNASLHMGCCEAEEAFKEQALQFRKKRGYLIEKTRCGCNGRCESEDNCACSNN